jgi:flavin reductase (DIM6/NTAB) family NADH-FMN oxidoreductase RutF
MKIKSEDVSGHKLHKLLGTAVSPRPVALISTVGEDGIYNAAPYSSITPVSFKPPVLCIGSGMKGGEEKDTAKNIMFSKDFVVNILDDRFIEPVIRAAANYPSNVDEIKEVGLTAVSSDSVAAPRIAEAQISLECRLVQQLAFGSGEDRRTVIFGEVLLLHVKDEIWKGDSVDPMRLKSVGRMSAGVYCRTTDIIKIKRS